MLALDCPNDKSHKNNYFMSWTVWKLRRLYKGFNALLSTRSKLVFASKSKRYCALQRKNSLWKSWTRKIHLTVPRQSGRLKRIYSAHNPAIKEKKSYREFVSSANHWLDLLSLLYQLGICPRLNVVKNQRTSGKNAKREKLRWILYIENAAKRQLQFKSPS
jgi:hypothetical protein